MDEFFSPGTLRKQYESISDPKYAGVKTTRKEIMEEGSISGIESDMEGQDEESDFELTNHQTSGLDEREKDVPSESEEEEEEEERGVLRQDQDHLTSTQEPVDDLTSTLRRKRDEDRKKGRAVSRQIVSLSLFGILTKLEDEQFVGLVGLATRCSDTLAKVAECRQ